MNTHDVLAFAVASEAVGRIRQADQDWTAVFSATVYSTTARGWPMPDFVIVDEDNKTTTAGEFKPPDQTKREYLTGLGQALAYTRDFHYSLLVAPQIADDGYPIADHIEEVLAQDIASDLPVGLLTYDPGVLSSTSAAFDVLRPLQPRADGPANAVPVENSFWAKWRESSPEELGLFLEYLYDEARVDDPALTIRDRAFDHLWQDMVDGKTRHWGGKTRKLTDSKSQKIAWGKNFRNFVAHLGWCTSDGALTGAGLSALHIQRQYGTNSQVFLDSLARGVLLDGKHLVLLNEINEFQDASGGFESEGHWLDQLEENLEDNGLLKRNPARHQAAVQGSARQFLKAEKQLWRNLGLIVPRGARAYHPGRGFIFDWSRITSLL